MVLSKLVSAGAFVSAGFAQQPVFRLGAGLVAVAANVVDDEGRAVERLGPEDFTIEVDGTQRRIISVQFVVRGGSLTSTPSSVTFARSAGALRRSIPSATSRDRR